ncbi:MAG TPA: transporter substrate-binding domain-containing protein [Solirubrobacteraceae bacterium]|nr:transporter substrate-binding domain-containing protein [Solirubrobacteraceae bacterium]
MRRISSTSRLLGVACALAAIVATAAIGSSVASASSCTPKHPGLKTVSKGYLTAAYIEVPPYATIKNGVLGGAEGQIVTKIAQMECLKVKPLAAVAAGEIPDITSGRSDTAIGSWYRTAARAKIILLGDPELKVPMVIVSKKSDPIKTIPKLKGHKVGAVIGYLWTPDAQKYLGSNLLTYETADAEYRDLAAGRTQAVLDDAISYKGQMKLTPISGTVAYIPPPNSAIESSVKPGQPQLGVNKDNPALHKAMDADLESLRASGELRKILISNGIPAADVNPGPADLIGN